MEEITSITDFKNDVRRFSSGDRIIVVDARAIKLNGLRKTLESAGLEIDSTPIPVFQSGREVGKLSSCWNAQDCRETLLYRARETDFKRSGGKWIADKMLAPGDMLLAGVHLYDKPDY